MEEDTKVDVSLRSFESLSQLAIATGTKVSVKTIEFY